MQKRDTLEFNCQKCKHPIRFSIFEIDSTGSQICCSSCNKKYAFHDPDLIRQLKKFEALCRQLIESEEILSSTAVGIDLGAHHVKVPYKILLTRLNSTLDLKIGDQSLSISFRIEPVKDLSTLLSKPSA